MSTLGQGSPCKDKYGSSFDDTIRTTTYPALVKTLKAVRAKAPKARIAILSYPWILPASDGCFPQMPVATGDVPYLRRAGDAQRRRAPGRGRHRTTYVDLNAGVERPRRLPGAGVRWIEPVLGGTNPVIVHPNALGESQMAAQTLRRCAWADSDWPPGRRRSPAGQVDCVEVGARAVTVEDAMSSTGPSCAVMACGAMVENWAA